MSRASMALQKQKRRAANRAKRARQRKNRILNSMCDKDPNVFYSSEKWLALRYEAFRLHGRKCLVCGATGRLHVDHIKPRSIYPELQWDINNLQILCEQCNKGKSNFYEDDWRPRKKIWEKSGPL